MTLSAAPPSASVSTLPTLAELGESRHGVTQRFVFFGGKGGVGKTSTSTAMAVHLADRGLRTLVRDSQWKLSFYVKVAAVLALPSLTIHTP